MPRIRLDTLLVDRGLVASKQEATTAIRAGRVRIGKGGARADKPGAMVAVEEAVELVPGRRFVSRGGLKLEAALDAFAVDPAGRDCLDVGASTGGFTDCLLQRGARHVIAVDVGRGQLDWGLRNDERVTAIEGLHARELDPGALPYRPSLIVADVSFIGLSGLIGPILSVAEPGADLFGMVKPQFELPRDRVGAGGVVRDAGDRRDAVLLVIEAALSLGASVCQVAPAGVPGPKGNLEIFVRLRNDGEGRGRERARALAEEAVR